MEESIKDFLRRHDFRHLRDVDRGAIWTNGVEKVAVMNSYVNDQGAERVVMDRVRRLAREKILRKADEERKFKKKVEKTRLATMADAVIRQWPEATPEDVAAMKTPISTDRMTPEQGRAEQEAVGRAMRDDAEILGWDAEKVAVPKKPLPPPAGKLPRLVMKILLDEDITASKKVKMIIAWATDDDDEAED